MLWSDHASRGSTAASAVPLNVPITLVASGARIFFQLNKNSANSCDSTIWSIAITYVDRCIDSDGDGMADVLEDRNGDGLAGSGETDWQNDSDGGFSVRLTQPKPNSPLP